MLVFRYRDRLRDHQANARARFEVRRVSCLILVRLQRESIVASSLLLHRGSLARSLRMLDQSLLPRVSLDAACRFRRVRALRGQALVAVDMRHLEGRHCDPPRDETGVDQVCSTSLRVHPDRRRTHLDAARAFPSHASASTRDTQEDARNRGDSNGDPARMRRPDRDPPALRSPFLSIQARRPHLR